MTQDLSRVEKFEKVLADVDYYIEQPTSFLYDQIEDPNIQEIVECTRGIAVSNFIYITTKREKNERLKELISTAATIKEETVSLVQPEQSDAKVVRTTKDFSEVIELIIYSCLSDELHKILDDLSQEDLKVIKLTLYKIIIDIKQEIKNSIMMSPTSDITKLQDSLNAYEIALESLKEYKKEQTTTEEIENEEYSNIVIAPNNRKSTYFYEDILDFQERTKEIKLIFEKIVDGYFLKTKDTKPIEGYSEKIYEYKHPNGIRVLYFVMGNIIIICSLFMKDKQKSTKIASEYEEAISRYYECEQYIKDNFDTPDFHIEQAELVGEIFTLLDGITLSKKVGE